MPQEQMQRTDQDRATDAESASAPSDESTARRRDLDEETERLLESIDDLLETVDEGAGRIAVDATASDAEDVDTTALLDGILEEYDVAQNFHQVSGQ